MSKIHLRSLVALLLTFVSAAVGAQEVTRVRYVHDSIFVRDTVYVNQAPDTSAIAAAVRATILRVLNEQNLGRAQNVTPETDESHRTRAEQIWDRSQSKRKIERVPREMMKSTFVPKGQWMVGGTINFSEWDTDNYNLTVLKNVDIEGHTFSASPYFGYFVAKNLAIGARYNYTRNYFFLGKFDLNLGDDFNISLEDIYYLGHTHTFDFFVRPYLSLSKSNTYGAFVEIRTGYAHTTSKNSTGSGVTYDGSFTKTNTLQLNVCPGMAVFATDFLAVEASIGIMGLKYRWVDQKTNQVETGKSRTAGANFKFNFLSVNLGLTFYL